MVSVVIPVYNSAPFVAATLESVLAQTYRNLEILIVDDGSQDKSIAICRGFDDARIRILHQSNRGLAGARNTGIRHSRGCFVALLDSDDIWRETKVERHVAHLEARESVGVSFSNSEFIDESGRSLGLYQMGKLEGITARDIFLRNPVGNGSSIVLRKRMLDEIATVATLYEEPEAFYFDESFRQSEDVECWLRIALTTSWQFEGLPEPLTLYRVNAGGLSANLIKQYSSWERYVEKTATYAPDFIRTHIRRARGYYLRYLARRATSQGNRRTALHFLVQALRTSPLILLQDPLRTLVTAGAVLSLLVLPRALYRRLEATAMAFTGRSQRRRMARECAAAA
ncbi:glycosyltransferase family 2 protein [Synechococcus sp. RSCCF101]|nr:glycosyltransferase family 2 protein [Synechococcus sp. RSCCF101]